MIDPAVKTALGACVLLTGVCAAMLFRHGPIPTTIADSNPPLSLRSRAQPAVANNDLKAGLLAGVVGETPGGERQATVVTPLDRREPPPVLSPEYPAADRKITSRWGVSMEMMLPVSASADDATRSHMVIDGDTLEALAARYLGSSARAGEIFDANRKVLHDPRLLPIGVELKIPPRNASAPQTPVR